MPSNSSTGSSSVNWGIIASGIVVLVSSIFLLAYDRNLMDYGRIHWYGLVSYVVIVAILLLLSTSRSSGVKMILVAIPVIFIVLILADAAFNLPLSQFYSPHNSMFGFRYLFGFGAGGDSSTVAVSSGLVIDLIFSALLASFSAAALRR